MGQIVIDAAWAQDVRRFVLLSVLADVAEVAAQVLTQDGHVHATYSLCGTERLSGEEIAAAVARSTGVRCGWSRSRWLSTFAS